MKTVRLASMANSANNPNIARQAYETSQFAVNRANNVATGRLPNTYTPYDSNGNPYGYFNSSRQTGKTPSPDAPRVEDVSGSDVYYCTVNAKSKDEHDLNRRPNEGEPGSTWESSNGDKKVYGPDGKPEHDYDHDDHGYPDKHPHDENGGHYHDWVNGKRGDPYTISPDILIGAGLTVAGIFAVVVLIADDMTGIGATDDALLAPAWAFVTNGIAIITG